MLRLITRGLETRGRKIDDYAETVGISLITLKHTSPGFRSVYKARVGIFYQKIEVSSLHG